MTYFLLEKRNIKSLKQKVENLNNIDFPFVALYLDRGTIWQLATSVVSDVVQTEEFRALERIFMATAIEEDTQAIHEDITETHLDKVLRRIGTYFL
jgi:hypothetical protein